MDTAPWNINKKVPFFPKCYFMVFLSNTMPKVHFCKDSGCCPKILDYTLNIQGRYTYFIINKFFQINIFPPQVCKKASFLFRDVHLVKYGFNISHEYHFFGLECSTSTNWLVRSGHESSSLFNNVPWNSALQQNTTLVHGNNIYLCAWLSFKVPSYLCQIQLHDIRFSL